MGPFKRYNWNLEWLFRIIAVVSFILAILTALHWPPFRAIVGAFLFTALLILTAIVAGQLVNWYRSRPRVRYIRSLEEAPEYKIDNILNSIKDGKIKKMEVIARTSFRLLGGDEGEYQEDETSFRKKQKELQSRYLKALHGGGEVLFVVQNPNITVPSFTDEPDKLALLKEQAQVAIDSYKTIFSGLTGSGGKGKVSLFITNEVINNSMVRLTDEGHKITLIRDLSIAFKRPFDEEVVEEKKTRVEKPFLIFWGKGKESGEFREEFENILSHSKDVKKFEKARENGLREVQEKIDRHDCYSQLRGNESKCLAGSATSCFMADNNLGKHIPPKCIHFIITDECTTKCVMCDHHKMHNQPGKGAELELPEVKNVLRCIQDMGTKCVIISGGEPLARKDLFDILRYGKDQCQLNLGLITNGVCYGNGSEGRTFVSADQAKIIAETCSWVQLSIDSFRENIYKEIRGGDCLEIAKDSLRKIHRAIINEKKSQQNLGLELCFTIQKDNAAEIANLNEAVNDLPANVPIRLKFAHGPENGRKFLLDEGELEKVINQLRGLGGQFNSGYLLNMIQEGYFPKKDLCDGTPLRQKMKDWKREGYICHILRLTCVISANGIVYPCCFLFDDNHADSRFRDHYHRAQLSLKGPAGVMAPSSGNALAKIWHEDKLLNGLRKEQLPVDPEACSYCTRYFYQNELLNEVYNTFRKYEDCGVAEEFIKRMPSPEILGNIYWI